MLASILADPRSHRSFSMDHMADESIGRPVFNHLSNCDANFNLGTALFLKSMYSVRESFISRQKTSSFAPESRCKGGNGAELEDVDVSHGAGTEANVCESLAPSSLV